MMTEQQTLDSAVQFAEAMTQAGVPDPGCQDAFLNLMLEVRAMQQVIKSCRWFWENDLEQGLVTLTETTRPKVESLVMMIRRVQHLYVAAPVPEIVFRAVVDADAALREFTLACMPVRVLH